MMTTIKGRALWISIGSRRRLSSSRHPPCTNCRPALGDCRHRPLRGLKAVLVVSGGFWYSMKWVPHRDRSDFWMSVGIRESKIRVSDLSTGSLVQVLPVGLAENATRLAPGDLVDFTLGRSSHCLFSVSRVRLLTFSIYTLAVNGSGITMYNCQRLSTFGHCLRLPFLLPSRRRRRRRRSLPPKINLYTFCFCNIQSEICYHLEATGCYFAFNAMYVLLYIATGNI